MTCPRRRCSEPSAAAHELCVIVVSYMTALAELAFSLRGFCLFAYRASAWTAMISPPPLPHASSYPALVLKTPDTAGSY